MTHRLLAAGGAPLDPASADARRSLAEELAKPDYHPQPNPLQRVWEWVQELLSTRPGGVGLGSVVLLVLVLVVVATLVALAAKVLRADARLRSTTPGIGESVLDEPDVDAATYRRRAGAALAVGDWSAVVREAYRAIARSGIERAILEDLPGRTAREVAIALGPVFPSYAGRLREGAASFDAVRYGHALASERAARDLLALEEDVRRARPLHVDPVAP